MVPRDPPRHAADLFLVFEGNLAHSNLDQRFPFRFHYAVPTVQNHYLHHGEPRRLQDSNYASLPLWDVIFGTYNHPERNPVPATGLAGDPVPPGFLAQVAYPFRELLRPHGSNAAGLGQRS